MHHMQPRSVRELTGKVSWLEWKNQRDFVFALFFFFFNILTTGIEIALAGNSINANWKILAQILGIWWCMIHDVAVSCFILYVFDLSPQLDSFRIYAVDYSLFPAHHTLPGTLSGTSLFFNFYINWSIID